MSPPIAPVLDKILQAHFKKEREKKKTLKFGLGKGLTTQFSKLIEKCDANPPGSKG